MIIVYPNCFNFPVIKEINDNDDSLFRKSDDEHEDFTDEDCRKHIDLYEKTDCEYADSMTSR